MKKRPDNNNPSEYKLFTGGKSKTNDFTIFYNLAFANMKKFTLDNTKQNEEEEEETSETHQTPIPNFDYKALAEFLWKAHTQARNRAEGYKVSEGDRQLINNLYRKLEDLRNYHSHIWHNNKVLTFPEDLKSFVLERYEQAKNSLYETHPQALEAYERLLRKKDNKKHRLFDEESRITQEGRVFFLSFFLTTGQMSRLLQQRRGSKLNERMEGRKSRDIPLYGVKHTIYKYYCHRDGASISAFNHEDSLLSDLNGEEVKNILMARHGYRLETYLFDYPEYLADNATLPLFVRENNTAVKVETVQQLAELITDHRLLPGFHFEELIYTKEADTRDEHAKNRSISFTHRCADGYVFHIGFENLYKLTILCLKYGNEKAEPFVQSLQKIAEQRRQMHAILVKLSDHLAESLTDEEREFIADRKNRNLRGYSLLTRKGIEFFEDYDAGRDKAVKNKAAALANKLRPAGTIPIVTKTPAREPEPVVVYAQDFVQEKTEQERKMGTGQKFRAGNRFVFYAARFLIDHNIVPDWYWEVESFDKKEIEKYRSDNPKEKDKEPASVKRFCKQIPTGYRLCLENDHVTVGIPRSTAFQDDITLPSNKRHEMFYQFSLGPKALKYLLAIHITKNGVTDLNGFLAGAMKEDLARLEAGDRNFDLLEEKFLPSYLSDKEATDSINTLLDKAKKRIEHIFQEWDTAIQKRPYLKRAEKNRIIMECYRLFDWPTDEPNGIKFFRANEYNEMSVCHYSVGVLTDDPATYKTQSWKFKWQYLFEDKFQLDKRKPAIPPPIKNLLIEAHDINQLSAVIRKLSAIKDIEVLKEEIGRNSKKHDINRLKGRLLCKFPLAKDIRELARIRDAGNLQTAADAFAEAVNDLHRAKTGEELIDAIDRIYQIEHLDQLLKKLLKQLKEINTLDYLMMQAIKSRREYLLNTLDLLLTHGIPKPKKKELLFVLCRKLGISIPDAMQTEERRSELRQKRKHTLKVLPFAVHPMLVIKHLSPEHYKENSVSLHGTKDQMIGVFKKLRQQYSKGLHKPHYNPDFVTRLFPPVTGEADDIWKKQRHKWMGAINDTLTEDAILWFITKEYWKANPYTEEMATALKDNSGLAEVGRLYGADIRLNLAKSNLYMTMKMHQLDDVMYTAEKTKLKAAALHYHQRHIHEAGFWPPDPEANTEERRTQGKLPYFKGNSADPIPYEILRREIQLVAQHGMYLAQYLLDWERQILTEATNGMPDDEKQIFLRQKGKEYNKNNNDDYLSFAGILGLGGNRLELHGIDETIRVQVRKYRNRAFHDRIPTREVKESFSYWARPESPVGKLLGIAEPLHTPKDRSRFIQPNENGDNAEAEK